MAFMKAQKRRVAERAVDDTLHWSRSYTEPGACLDRILRINVDMQRAYLWTKCFGDEIQRDRAA
jgi:hypothetical protein